MCEAAYVCECKVCLSVSAGLCLYLSLDDKPGKLIGFGCDGTSVNMGANALRGCLESDRPWAAGLNIESTAKKNFTVLPLVDVPL